MSGESRQEDLSRIELFEALGHPLRVKIIETLDASPLGFADLKRKVGVESSGHLTFHLSKLRNLVRADESGNYSLTDDGREALRLMDALARERQVYRAPSTFKEWWTGNKKIASIVIIAIIIISLGIYIYNLNSSIENQRHSQASQIRDVVIETWSDLSSATNTIDTGNKVAAIGMLIRSAERIGDTFDDNRGASEDYNRFLDSTRAERSVIAMTLQEIAERIFDGTVMSADKEFVVMCTNATRYLFESLPSTNYPPAFLEQYHVSNLATNINNFHSLCESRPQYEATVSSVSDLRFHMEINTTIIQSGESIAITITESNLASAFNNITVADDWTYRGFQSPICSPSPALWNLPFNIAILQGNYTEADLNGTDSLPIYYPPNVARYVYCVFIGSPTGYDFYPNSDMAVINTQYAFLPINRTISTTIELSGYYNSTSYDEKNSFAPGVYTVVGGDEWGRLIVDHFTVIG